LVKAQNDAIQAKAQASIDARRAADLAAMPQPQRRINEAMAAAASKPISVVGPLYKGGRPSFADDIDAMVAALVRSGDVVFDAAADCYRAPWCRRFKFGG